jgi:hypothetical protein
VSTDIPGGASQNWFTTNVGFTAPMEGEVYLVLKSPGPVAVDFPLEYDPATVGLTLDNDPLGVQWVIIEEIDPVLGPLYFPAISLGFLQQGDSTSYTVKFVLSQPMTVVTETGFELGLPSIGFDGAYVPIPEPGTGLLVALGTAALAAIGRRRR